MEYKINNAIIKKNRETGEFALIDPEGNFSAEDKLMVINNEDYITMQLLINAILRNEFKSWNSVKWDEDDKLKSLLVKLGYTRNDIARMLQEF
ncbi:MAG: hypothetical protein MJ224_04240 [archaeon]|nr:hypothetical protein [archaeon]